jgi:hypothetical protein
MEYKYFYSFLLYIRFFCLLFVSAKTRGVGHRRFLKCKNKNTGVQGTEHKGEGETSSETWGKITRTIDKRGEGYHEKPYW